MHEMKLLFLNWWSKVSTFAFLFWGFIFNFFLPVSGLVITAITLIILDTVIGTLYSINKGEKLQSSKAWKLSLKLAVAVMVICGLHVVDVHFLSQLPSIPYVGEAFSFLSLAGTGSLGIIWPELISICESLNGMFGWDLMGPIERRLSFLKIKKPEGQKEFTSN